MEATGRKEAVIRMDAWECDYGVSTGISYIRYQRKRECRQTS